MFTKILLSFFLIFSLFEVVAQKSKPNIIFILADDLGYGDLGCYGSTQIITPNIDGLAKSGTKFTQFYAGSTVCAPSRASLMTGLHTGHVSIRGNGEVPLAASDSILPQYLHHAGYKNGIVGKWGLGLAGTTGAPENKGWDFFAGLLHHVEGHYQKPDSAWQIMNGKSTKVKIPENQYSNEWFTNQAKKFIKEQQSNPFFLYIAYTLPHAELVVPKNAMLPYLTEEGASKFGPENAHPSGQHYGSQAFPKAAYAAMVSQMDQYIGELIAYLKAQKLYDNTIIVFTSDNGTHKEGGRTKADIDFFNSSGGLKGAKRDLYEGGIRVPFIVSWKGKVKSGSINNYTGAFWDILPTFNEIAGVAALPETDGISFVNALKGKKQLVHNTLYWEFYEGGFKQAILQNNWKAIRYYKGTTPTRTELYNLAVDKGETIDIADQNQPLVELLEALMDKERIKSSNPLFQIK
ncbi:MAG: chloramphenicol resistance protein [Sediminibacterium sp.]|nr:MAG: chloramphenicol resistance protein [Sediminibacterium sp.] [Sediminibacterium sp. FEMGT703S]